MENTAHRAIAIVGAGAILPDAPNVSTFWENVKNGRYSITEVDRTAGIPRSTYDSDHSAPDKTYSKIGGWVREFVWDPIKWRLADPAARRSMRWMKRRNGRLPARAKRWKTTAIPNGR